MTDILDILIVMAILAVLFGVVYPVYAAVLWLLYRCHGGRDSFRDWMKTI